MRNHSLGVMTLIFVLVAVLLFVFMPTTLALAALTGYVVSQQGTVEVCRKGRSDWQPLAPAAANQPARVIVGDQIRTGTDGRVALKWADGTRLQLEPASTMTVNKYQFNTQNRHQVSLLRLRAGKVWARVSHELAGDSRFEVQTPTAVAGVRGTIFSVEASERETLVEVLDGSVQLTLAKGGGGLVEAGHLARAAGTRLDQSSVDAAAEERLAELDILLPSVRFNRFLPGLVKPDGSYALRGEAEPGAALLIDGRSVAVADDGTFALVVTLRPGENRFTVKVTDAAGHSRESEEQVTFQPKTQS